VSDEKVVALEQRARDRGGDDARFVSCSDCGSDDFSVVVRFANGRPFVAALVCTSEACAESPGILVENGFLQ
jgi:hypothetical protein